MRTLLRCCLLALLTLRAFAGLDGEGEEIAPGVVLFRSEFGIWDDDGNFKAGSTLEVKDGSNFGWRFRVRTEKEELKIRVVLVLPAPPKVWGWNGEIVEKNVSSDGRMKLSADRRTATVEVERPVDDGWLMNAWTFGDGDPYGAHLARVYIGEKLVRVFRFRLIEPRKKDPM
jgi:hypothetical protein